jgi:acyl-CoA reductase-like NAD-dependent aldehyde dehydrogenase
LKRWRRDFYRSADHFILTTPAPRVDANSATSISDRNTLIRALAAELGVHLIDLAEFTSNDNGMTWKSSSLHIGDGIHYTETVRTWLGNEIVSWMSTKEP